MSSASPIITDIDQAYLMHAYHATRLAHKLSHTEAGRSADFWADIGQMMMSNQSHGRVSAAGWRQTWQRMHSKLLLRIEQARRQKRTDSAWLTVHNIRLLAVIMDDVDPERLDYVERCMVDDVLDDDDDRLVLCAAVYRDTGTNRFVMRCQSCRQSYRNADELLAHVQRYYESSARPTDRNRVHHHKADTNPSQIFGGRDESSVEVQPPVVDDKWQNVQADDGLLVPIKDTLANVTKNLPVKLAHSNLTPEPQPTTSNPMESHMEADIPSDRSSSSSSAEDDFFDDYLPISNVVADGQQEPKRLSYACTRDGCTDRFVTQGLRNKHSLAMHGCRALQCPQCPASLAHNRALALHVREHASPLLCDICKRTFANKANLRCHMRVHDQSADYKCPMCEQRFRYAYQRANHQRIEHGPGITKQCVCEQCGMSFRFMNELRKHNASKHTNERLFKCELCGKRYRSKDYLTNHKRNVHAIVSNKFRFEDHGKKKAPEAE